MCLNTISSHACRDTDSIMMYGLTRENRTSTSKREKNKTSTSKREKHYYYYEIVYVTSSGVSTARFISGTASSVGGGFRDWTERVSRGRETVITSDNSSSLEVSSSCAVTFLGGCLCCCRRVAGGGFGVGGCGFSAGKWSQSFNTVLTLRSYGRVALIQGLF
jgi:hypothetical protein